MIQNYDDNNFDLNILDDRVRPGFGFGRPGSGLGFFPGLGFGRPGFGFGRPGFGFGFGLPFITGLATGALLSPRPVNPYPVYQYPVYPYPYPTYPYYPYPVGY